MAWFPRTIYTADILDKNRIFLRKRRADEGLPEGMQHIAVPVVEIKGRSSSQTAQWRFAMLISGLRYPADRFLWPRFLFCFDLETTGVSEEPLEELYRLNRTEESMRRRRPAPDRPADSGGKRVRKSSSSSAPAAKPPAAKPPAAKPPAAKPRAAKPPAAKPATKPQTKPRVLQEKPPPFMKLGRQPGSPDHKKVLPVVKKSTKKNIPPPPEKKAYKKKVMAGGMGKLPPTPKKRRAKQAEPAKPAKPGHKTERSSVDRTPEKSLPLRGGTTPVSQERKPGRQGSFTRMLEQQTWFAPENKRVSEGAEPQESAYVSPHQSDASFVLDPSPDETIMLVNRPSSSTSVPAKKAPPSGGAFDTMDQLAQPDEDQASRRWFGKKRKHGRQAPEPAGPPPSPSWFGRIRHRKRRE
ncbi:MAG: uncharacterized protein KVP18_003367 [Porospora cf. gigantea A]|nr:MAG: hypothetical protein KVP18_003367 [Porospora cf. gigantea A]